MAPDTTKMSAFERRRLENMKANQAILRDLSTTADKLQKKAAPKKPASRQSNRKVVPVKREPALPTRTSSRLAGKQAESVDPNSLKHSLDDVVTRNDRPKRQRVSGDLNLSEIVVPGKNWTGGANLLAGLVRGATPYERSFPANGKLSDEETSEDLKELRERISSLMLYEKFEPNQIKITPERVYSLAFHPTSEKPLVFAGDKSGNLGIFDASEQDNVKSEDDDEDEEPSPKITAFTLHPNTISGIVFGPDASHLFTSSYDSSIRRLDLEKGVASEVYAAPPGEDVSISCLDIVDAEPSLLYFSTLTGYLGRHDIRTRKDTEFFMISEKKVGGFSVHPTQPHLIAAGSLDRTMRIWDLRKVTTHDDYVEPHQVGEHVSRLSISHAAWSSTGKIATSSYDDTVKVFSYPSAGKWTVKEELDEAAMKPAVVIPHNNQTGRWVSILKPYWQQAPADGVQKLVIGNMNRFVDIYSSEGEQLAQLGGDGIGQVPAVAKFHPTQNWVAGGTASGKLCLWM